MLNLLYLLFWKLLLSENNVVLNDFFHCMHRYEMSQDLLDKQIEILERKYGGLRARKAAYTIQRAFRRYTLLKKFSAITAMAKAEKRISAKANNTTVVTTANGVTTIGVDPQSIIHKLKFNNLINSILNVYVLISDDIYSNPSKCSISDNKLCLARPMRSMSLRERHDLDLNLMYVSVFIGNYISFHHIWNLAF